MSAIGSTLRIMGTALVMTVFAGIVLWFWNDSLRSREAALQACANACTRLNVQFLDQTVALERLGLGRGHRRLLSVWRLYSFEFSTDGSGRDTGHAMVLGCIVEYIHMDHPTGGSLFDASTPDAVQHH